jgi:hypothetical protein
MEKAVYSSYFVFKPSYYKHCLSTGVGSGGLIAAGTVSIDFRSSV